MDIQLLLKEYLDAFAAEGITITDDLIKWFLNCYSKDDSKDYFKKYPENESI